jgi:hypothetical protein
VTPKPSLASITRTFADELKDPVRLLASGDVPLWLTMHMRTSLDPEGHLVTQESTYTLSKGLEAVELLHYDYERDKEGYPDAHVQVIGGSADWDEVLVASGPSRGGWASYT